MTFQKKMFFVLLLLSSCLASIPICNGTSYDYDYVDETNNEIQIKLSMPNPFEKTGLFRIPVYQLTKVKRMLLLQNIRYVEDRFNILQLDPCFVAFVILWDQQSFDINATLYVLDHYVFFHVLWSNYYIHSVQEQLPWFHLDDSIESAESESIESIESTESQESIFFRT